VGDFSKFNNVVFTKRMFRMISVGNVCEDSHSSYDRLSFYPPLSLMLLDVVVFAILELVVGAHQPSLSTLDCCDVSKTTISSTVVRVELGL
jgi:hypothetical protein